MSRIFVSGGRLLDPGQGLDRYGDLVISGNKIAAIADGRKAIKPGDIVIEAKGLVICPGFIDLHCHLREPGFEDKETIATGTRAAAQGGFTTVCCMPNTQPPLDSRAAIDFVKEKAHQEGIIRVLPIGCITRGRRGEELAEMVELAEAGVVGFSDDGEPVMNSRVMSSAMDYSRSLGLPLIDHCEDKNLTEDGLIHDGWVAAHLGLKGMPSAAEEIMVARDLALAELTHCQLHICHVSTSGAVELIRQGKRKGIRVTAEVTPCHLVLTDERILNYDTDAKVNPPLRTEKDTAALVEGIRDGTIDAIATDHAPHTLVDKQCEFALAAFGISSLETALGCVLKLVHKDRLELKLAVSKLTCEPAKVIGRYGELGSFKTGSVADVTIFDLDKEWTVNTAEFASKGKNNPFDGQCFKGKVMATIANGNIAYKDDSLIVKMYG